MAGHDDDSGTEDDGTISDGERRTDGYGEFVKSMTYTGEKLVHDPSQGLAYREDRIDEEAVKGLINWLLIIEMQSIPHPDDRPWSLKDMFAKQALSTAGTLLRHTIRWAVMHEVGMALSGTPAAVYHRLGTSTEAQIRGLMRAGRHEHEVSGASWPETDPAVARRALATVVEHVLDFWKPAQDLAEALRALDAGEVRPILTPGGKGKHGAAYTLRELRLGALAHVEFRRGCGDSEEDARHEVATAFGASSDTLSTWRKRLPVKDPENQELLKQARAAGDTLRRLSTRPILDPADEELRSAILAGFGPAALAEIGSEHARALTAGKRSRPKR